MLLFVYVMFVVVVLAYILTILYLREWPGYQLNVLLLLLLLSVFMYYIKVKRKNRAWLLHRRKVVWNNTSGGSGLSGDFANVHTHTADNGRNTKENT